MKAELVRHEDNVYMVDYYDSKGRLQLTCGTYLLKTECKKISIMQFIILNKLGIVKKVF